ncbi:MAG: aldehyde ferredoxin oxidoreductase family protein [Candidatus Aminicenantes bacterium]|jgi:aldehyde:ferredoxin oxidoreductase
MDAPLIPGYHGKILEIDLSRLAVEVKPLKPEIIEGYLGGRGLATRLFYDCVDPGCDPLDGDNVLVFATSPLLGTSAPTACRGHMVFKSPLTGLIGSPNCGGTWAHAFKSSGYDVFILKGKAAEPVFIDIGPEKVEMSPADSFWGLEVDKTIDHLTPEDYPGRKPRILCIGPAGENRVRFAAVLNDKSRAYGRTGPGAVFGSKNLKAIRVSGKEKIQITDREQYQSGLDQARYLIKQAPVTKRLLRELGTSGLLKLIDVIEMLPHRNFQDNLHRIEDLDNVSGEALKRNILERAGGCHGCPMACQRHTRVGDKKGEGPEYETMVMTGPNCHVYNLEAIARANYRCNELGMDTISFGGTMACAMELYERELINQEDTGGLDLKFGNADILEETADLIAYRQGIGDKMAEGSFRLAGFYNHPEYSMSIKKQEIPAYDPRASYTQALGYMTSPTGACHLRGGYAVSLAFFSGTKEIPRYSILQSPIAIRNMQNLGIIQDSLGICRFTGFAFSTDPWARMVSAVTGREFSTARLEEVANRIAALERLFNLAAGVTSEDDTLPERFSSEPIVVEGKERTVPKTVRDRLKKDYYEVRGWDAQGRPKSAFLRDLEIKTK